MSEQTVIERGEETFYKTYNGFRWYLTMEKESGSMMRTEKLTWISARESL